jgi:hypothetical protein
MLRSAYGVQHQLGIVLDTQLAQDARAVGADGLDADEHAGADVGPARQWGISGTAVDRTTRSSTAGHRDTRVDAAPTSQASSRPDAPAPPPAPHYHHYHDRRVRDVAVSMRD